MAETNQPSSNPLLASRVLPAYSAVKPEHVEPAVRELLAAQRRALVVAEGVATPDLDWLRNLERITVELDRVWGPVWHLNSVLSSPPLRDAFKTADQVLHHATKGISDLITVPGLVNLDFADVKTVMAERGNALMGAGYATGPTRAYEAAQSAVSSPLLDDISISGAEALLVNVTGGESMTLHEISEAVSVVVDAAGHEANVIFGAVIDDRMGDGLSITVIATGFGRAEAKMRPATYPRGTRMPHARPQPAPVAASASAPAQMCELEQRPAM